MSEISFLDLSVELAGVKMRSPVGIGSVGFPLVNLRRLTPDSHAEVLLEHVNAGAGFICLPFLAHVSDELLEELSKKAKPYEYSWEVPSPIMFLKGERGLYLFSSPGIPPKRLARRFKREGLRLIEVLKEKKPQDVPIIANVAGLGAFPQTYVDIARACESAGVDLIELNLSCPIPVSLDEAVEGYFEKEFTLCFAGLMLGDQPELVEDIVREVVQAVNIPVGVKASPETGFPRIIELARRVKRAGAKFINCSNMGITIVPPDIYNSGKPRWPFVDGNPFVSAGGEWLRMIIYKQVAAIAKYVPGLDIIATGGLMAPEHIVEAMMLGAKATELVTGVLYKGRSIIGRNIAFLTDYLKEQGYGRATALTGLGLKYIKPGNKIDFEFEKIYAEVDQNKCTGCGLCTEHICLASYLEDGVARIRKEDCLGCGMCVALCPSEAVVLKGE